MSKVTITESKLYQLIQESINEALEDEGIASFLGKVAGKIGGAGAYLRGKMDDIRREKEMGIARTQYQMLLKNIKLNLVNKPNQKAAQFAYRWTEGMFQDCLPDNINTMEWLSLNGAYSGARKRIVCFENACYMLFDGGYGPNSTKYVPNASWTNARGENAKDNHRLSIFVQQLSDMPSQIENSIQKFNESILSNDEEEEGNSNQNGNNGGGNINVQAPSAMPGTPVAQKQSQQINEAMLRKIVAENVKKYFSLK